MSFGRFPDRWDQLLRSIEEEEAGCGGWCLGSTYCVLSSCILQALDGWIPIFGQWTKWGSDKLFAQQHIGSVQKVKVKSLSHVQLFGTPWTVAHQASMSMGFSRQEYWSGLPFHSPGDLPDPRIEPGSPALQADALLSEPPGKYAEVEFKSSSFSLPLLGKKSSMRVLRLTLTGQIWVLSHPCSPPQASVTFWLTRPGTRVLPWNRTLRLTPLTTWLQSWGGEELWSEKGGWRLVGTRSRWPLQTDTASWALMSQGRLPLWKSIAATWHFLGDLGLWAGKVWSGGRLISESWAQNVGVLFNCKVTH